MQQPSIGRIVCFVHTKGTYLFEPGREYPAIIVSVVNEYVCDITVFDAHGFTCSMRTNVLSVSNTDPYYWKWPDIKKPAPEQNEPGKYLIVDANRKWIDRNEIKPGDAVKVMLTPDHYYMVVYSMKKEWQVIMEGKPIYKAKKFIDFFNPDHPIQKESTNPKFFLIK